MENLPVAKISIVLVATSHPGNIGASARAMKTMGLENLALVTPKHYPNAEVTARAAGADDILARAELFPTLEAAVRECGLVIGTSARPRNIPWPVLTPAEAAQEVVSAARRQERVAILFGRENSGLSNEELELCHSVIHIPTNPEYSSLNLAAAVQIICYELRKLMLEPLQHPPGDQASTPPANMEQMRQFYEQLPACLLDIGYYDPEKPRLLMRRLKRLFNRARLDINEYNILRGVLRTIQERLGRS